MYCIFNIVTGDLKNMQYGRLYNIKIWNYFPKNILYMYLNFFFMKQINNIGVRTSFGNILS